MQWRMTLGWDDFRLLLAVARAGSASGAGRSLGINQSTVSRRIRALEGRVAVRLFESLPSGLALTSAGEEVLAAAERMEREVEQIDRQVFGRDAALSGNVPEILMPTLAVDVAEFRVLHPDIRVDIQCDNNYANLTKRDADVAIRLQDSPPEHLVGRRIKSMPLAPYASTGYLARTGRPANLEVNHDWITGDDSWSKHDTNQWLRKHATDEHIACTTNSANTMLCLIRAGAGVGWTLSDIGDNLDDLVRIGEPVEVPGLALWLLTHEDLRTTPRFRVFLDFMAKRSARAGAVGL
jgi:DNA-binding transcriptional LysR family regulator